MTKLIKQRRLKDRITKRPETHKKDTWKVEIQNKCEKRRRETKIKKLLNLDKSYLKLVHPFLNTDQK